MENLIIELSKYLNIILFAIYTFYSFSVLRSHDKKRQGRIFRSQRILMHLIHLTCYMVLYLVTGNIKVVLFYLVQLAFLLAAMLLYQGVYKRLSKLVLNHMLMFFVISFIMLTRISFDMAVRQFAFVAAAMALCLVVPVLIERFRYWDRFGWIYAAVGIGLLLVVLIFAKENNGAKNWIGIFGIGIQPSEFVKILYVFFIAALLSKRKDFKAVVLITAAAGIHVILLVLEKDLGGALIYFITYLFMLYCATKNSVYLFSGLLAGSGAAVVAYKLFNHVRVRVMAWKNPWADIEQGGYQVAQSLFAIGTGGWFGLGLGQGLPLSIPVRESDFIFAAISEEMGGIFAVCIVLVSISCFVMFINISMKMKHPFFRLVAFGFSIQYIFQVFLNIGGVTKFIPSTGVTLPLISYGGSSVISMIIMFSMIQGLYVINQDEENPNGKEGKKGRKANKKDEAQASV